MYTGNIFIKFSKKTKMDFINIIQYDIIQIFIYSKRYTLIYVFMGIEGKQTWRDIKYLSDLIRFSPKIF